MMNHFEQSVQLITWLQQFSPELDRFFLFFTWFGDEQFFLVFLPFIFWCIDRNKGAALIVILFLSVYINSLLKWFGDYPRPFNYSPLVNQLTEVVNKQGFPSGHTQMTVLLWGYISIQFRKIWLWFITGIMIIMVPLSRLYLGVHFPVDLLGGFIFGVIILVAAVWIVPHMEKHIAKMGVILKMIIVILFPMLLLLLFNDKISLTAISTVIGFSLGLIFENKWIGYLPSHDMWTNMKRYLIGMLGLIGLWLGTRVVFESLDPPWLFRMARYIMCGLWVGFGAPWVFKKTIPPKNTQL